MLFAVLLAATAPISGAADSPLQTIRDLEKAVAAKPGNASDIRELAHAYALALLQDNPNVRTYATTALEGSRNVWILGNAAYMLQSKYNETQQWGSPNARAAMLAERYYLRARSLDPKLEREKILPHIDLQQIARANEARAQQQIEWARRFDEAAQHIRRLKPEAFADLPPFITAALRSRKCTMPQPTGATTPRNLIHGDFFEPGQQAWAALCSVNGWSTILVFRNAGDAAPQSLARYKDKNYLQGIDDRSVGYSREIQTVGRDFILANDRAYPNYSGRPVSKPARITHQGVDDAFLGKASVTWYFSAGKWLSLQGAD